jgi:hypothetical protein
LHEECFCILPSCLASHCMATCAAIFYMSTKRRLVHCVLQSNEGLFIVCYNLTKVSSLWSSQWNCCVLLTFFVVIKH